MTESLHTNEQLENGRPLGRFFLFSDEELERAAETNLRDMSATFHDDYREFIPNNSGVNLMRVEAELIGDAENQQLSLTDALNSSPEYESTIWLNLRADDKLNYVWQLWQSGTQYDLEVPGSIRADVTLTERQFSQPGLLRQIDRSTPNNIAQITAMITKIIKNPGFDAPKEPLVEEDDSNVKVPRSRVELLRHMQQGFEQSLEELDQKSKPLSTRDEKNRASLVKLATGVRFPIYNMDAEYGMPAIAMPKGEYEKTIRKITGKTALHYLDLAKNSNVEFGAKTIDPSKQDAGEVLTWLTRTQGLGRTASEAVLHMMVLQSYEQ